VVTNYAVGGRDNLKSDPTRNFRFLVTFQPYGKVENHPMRSINFGFSSVSGLAMAVESIPYREGGQNTTLHQVPGQATFSPITLTRGVHLGNNQAWRWITRLFAAVGPGTTANGSEAVGYPSFQFRSSVTIHVLQHPLTMSNDSVGGSDYRQDSLTSQSDPIAFSFRAYNAWISALAYSDLNAGDNAIAVEQMTLVHEGLDMFWEHDVGTKTASYDQAKAPRWLA
jgi:phage tail-like protein